MKLRFLVSMLLLFSAFAYGQMEDFSYKREMNGISNQWHSLILPDEVFHHINRDMSDLRIFGITAKNDTVEAPYILTPSKKQNFIRQIDFKYINRSRDNTGFYYTFEIPDTAAINEINLNFNRNNFNWQIHLEGSHNQNRWFSILEDYRILSFQNAESHFEYTTLHFPNSKYSFYRLHIHSKEDPALNYARISRKDAPEKILNNYPIQTIHVAEDKKNRSSEIDFTLAHTVPVNEVQLFFKDKIDYYRPIEIKYLNDSTLTQNGMMYHYSTATMGIATSSKNRSFDFERVIAKKFKIIITNEDNAALGIDSILVAGSRVELKIRFAEKATYFLTYGNKNAIKPIYDIARFTGNIPSHLSLLTLQDEKHIERPEKTQPVPLFQNTIWLWGILILVVILLGWFAFKMMGNK